jgi:transcriptional regulator GlxA family with amidase domain
MKTRCSLTSTQAAAAALHVEWTLPEPMSEVASAVMSLISLAARDGACESPWMQLLLAALAACGATRRHGPATSAINVGQGLSLAQMLRARELLADPDQAVTVRDVAVACGMSQTSFSQAFRVATGMSPRAWRLEARVSHAKRLLEGSDMSMTRIAGECGFGEQAYFNHIFSRLTTCSPGEWRRLHTKD